MRRKSETFEKFKEFHVEAEKQLGKSLKILRSDRGDEYLDSKFTDYLIENGIVSQLTAPGTSPQNGVDERRNRTLLDIVRSIMSYSTLPNSFWGYTLQMTKDILNVVPSKAIKKTPIELWCGRKPSLQYYRVWGCPAHVLSREKIEKLDSRTEVCLFIGYPKGTIGGIFYNPKDKKVFMLTHAMFLEHEYINDFKPRSKVLLEDFKERKSQNDTIRVGDKDTDSGQ